MKSSNKKKPLISVIMNCYNGEKYIYKSVRSILSQSYKNLELIFWDNCSTDKSLKIVKNFKDKRIRYFKSDKFLNLYDARNLAIKKANGEFVTFLDTDDWWKKNKIIKQLDKIKNSNDNVKLIYSNFYIYKNKKNHIFSKKNLPEGKITQNLLNSYCVGLLTIFAKKEIFNQNIFDKKLNIIGDFDFVIRVSKKYNISCVQEPLAFYRIHKNNYSLNNLNMFISELKYWLKKNEKTLKKNFSIKNQYYFLYKLKLKKILAYLNFKNYIGRVVQW